MKTDGIVIIPDLTYTEYSADITGAAIPVPHSAKLNRFHTYDTVTDTYKHLFEIPRDRTLYLIDKEKMLHAGLSDEKFITMQGLVHTLLNGLDKETAENDQLIKQLSEIPKRWNMIEEFAMKERLVIVANKFKKFIAEVNIQGRKRYLVEHMLNERMNLKTMRTAIPVDKQLIKQRYENFLINEDRYKEMALKYGVSNIFHRESYENIPELREVLKAVGSYTSIYRHGLLISPNSRITCNYTIDQKTGRGTSSKPNLPGIDKIDREVVRATHGWKIISIDLKSVEPRIAAYIYRDEQMKRDCKCESIYEIVRDCINSAEKIDLPLATVKHKIFIPYLYGQQPKSCAENAGISTQQAARIHKLLNKRYKTCEDNARISILKARADGHITLSNGHRVIVTEEMRPTQIRNHFIQANAAAVFFEAVRAIDKAFTNLNAEIIMSRHDEVMIHCPDEELDACTEIATTILQQSHECRFSGVQFPVECEIGDTWR